MSINSDYNNKDNNNNDISPLNTSSERRSSLRNSLNNSSNNNNNNNNNVINTPTANSINSSGNFSPKEFVSNIDGEEIIYQNQSVEYKQRLCTIQIKQSTLIIKFNEKGGFTKYLVSDTIVGSEITNESTNEYTIYSCVMNTLDVAKETRRRKQFSLRFKDRFELNQFNDKFVEAFLDTLPMGNPRERRIRVILNPKSGKKMSESIFKDINELFKDSKIFVKKTVTKGPDHAKKIGYKFNLKKYDTIVFISGDGLFHEFINGLLSRTDFEQARKIPLALIPGGTGNGIACSIGLQDPMSCALAVIRGFTKPLDVSVIQQGDKKWCSILSLTWGIVSDVDIESEKYRALGDVRLILGAALRILNLRIYRGKIWYLPALELNKTEIAKIPKCSYSCEICESDNPISTIESVISQQQNNNNNTTTNQLRRSSLNNSSNGFSPKLNTSGSISNGNDDELRSMFSKEENIKIENEIHDHQNDDVLPLLKSSNDQHFIVPPTKLPNQQFLKETKEELFAKGWKVLEGEFIGIVASTVSHLASDFIASPTAHLSDGLIDLVVINNNKKFSKAGLLSVLTESSTGAHVKSDLIDQYKVEAMILEPSNDREGIIAVDGELISYGRTSMECMRACINLICRTY
ncbi:hypothetical protein ACTFIW_011599 [Dictyostelium discoideum]